MAKISIHPIKDNNKRWIERLIRCHFGSEARAVHGKLLYPSDQEGFIAESEGRRVGLASLEIQDYYYEITTLDALGGCEEIYKELIEAVKLLAIRRECRTLRLTTTKDNTDSLRICQQCGFQFKALYTGAVMKSRVIKPEIQVRGSNDIPIRDEIELEMEL